MALRSHSRGLCLLFFSFFSFIYSFYVFYFYFFLINPLSVMRRAVGDCIRTQREREKREREKRERERETDRQTNRAVLITAVGVFQASAFFSDSPCLG